MTTKTKLIFPVNRWRNLLKLLVLDFVIRVLVTNHFTENICCESGTLWQEFSKVFSFCSLQNYYSPHPKYFFSKQEDELIENRDDETKTVKSGYERKQCCGRGLKTRFV